MHGLEKRALYWEYRREGLSKAAISRKLGVSRGTLYSWEAAGKRARAGYGPRRGVVSILEPYKEFIESRLRAYPKLSARRLFDEIGELGYSGGYGLVRGFVASVRPRPVAEPVIRFETAPGVQGQVDFATVKLPFGERQALVVVLGYSRMLWFRFYRSQRMGVLMRGLEEAFAFFGGVPQELLFDQMRAVVVADRRPSGGGVLKNAEFRRFAAHWDFRIRVCRPYRARTKGKVERPIRYLREAFVYGRELASDTDANREALRWLGRVANVRVHGTLKERPVDRWEREKPSLGRLADWPYRGVQPVVSPTAREPAGAPKKASPPVLRVAVEHRPLSEYGALVRLAR